MLRVTPKVIDEIKWGFVVYRHKMRPVDNFLPQKKGTQARIE